MAEGRTFNYDAVSSVYNEIKKITTGDDSIKTILDNINRDCHNMVDVENEAVYGELGKQLLLDWDNTSSNFPNFIDNFNNWSALIAQASGNYSEFENKISGFKQEHMLGATSEAGRTTAYTNDGYYVNSYSVDDLDELASLAKFYEPTGATYIDTEMVSYSKIHDIFEGISLALEGVTIVTSGMTFAKFFSSIGALTTTGNATNGVANIGRLRGNLVNHGGIPASEAVASHMSNSGFWQRFASTGLGTKISNSIIHSSFNWGKNTKFLSYLFSSNSPVMRETARNVVLLSAESVGNFGTAAMVSGIAMNGANYSLSSNTFDDTPISLMLGDETVINGQTYNFFGRTANGVGIYSDESGQLFYKNSSDIVSPVTFYSNGEKYPATLDNIDENTELVVDGSSVGKVTELDFIILGDDYKEYYDAISTNMELFAE